MTILTRPHHGPHTQAFGNIQPDGQPHAGDDFGYTDGVKVYPDVFAAAAGEVLYAGDARHLGWPNPYYLNPDFDRTDAQDSSAGNVVIVGHGDGMTTYNHLESIDVVKGQTVRQGQRIATTGDTGYSFGKHLHFEWIPYPANFSTATYGRARPTFSTITPQSTTTAKGALMALTDKEQDELLAGVRQLLNRTADIKTAAGPKSVRQFIADGTRAAQEAAENTADIKTAAGPKSVRQFIADGTRAAQNAVELLKAKG